AGKRPKPLYDFKQELEQLHVAIEQTEQTYGMNTLALKKILINMRNLIQRINNMYGYFDTKPGNTFRKEEADLKQFVERRDIDFKQVREILTLKSNQFRHAVRMATVLGVGYLISFMLDFGAHSYWILLTIMVILKPGFSLTKQRNFQRLAGTVIGGIVGA